MKSAVYSIIAALAAVVSLSAQEMSHFAFEIGAGYTAPVGRTGMYTDVGYNTSAGVGYYFNSHIGALIDLNVDSMGVTSTTLNHIGVPGGNLNVFSATLDPIVHLAPHSRLDVYVTGGGGYYRKQQIFVAPLFPTRYGGVPYFGFAPGNQIAFSESVNKPGFDAGIGLAFSANHNWRGKFFMEAKYNKIFLGGPFHVDYVPVTFGYRW